MNRRTVFQCAAVMFFLAAASGLLLQGSFGHFLALIPFLYLLAAWSAVVLIALIVAAFRRRMEGLRILATGWVLLAASISLSLLTGYAVHGYHTYQARRYVERAAGWLEAMKAKDGQYPRQFPEKQFEVFPRFLNANSYHSDGGRFSFSYIDPADIMGGYEFSSKTHQWAYWD